MLLLFATFVSRVCSGRSALRVSLNIQSLWHSLKHRCAGHFLGCDHDWFMGTTWPLDKKLHHYRGFFLPPLNLTTGDINHTTASAFWWGLTSCLVLFWYLSLRNSCRYSDPSVWRGSLVDEVRLLTAMKQYLKHIKRHFPWLDSRRFKLTQVLHLTTESGANALLHVFRRSTEFTFLSAIELQRWLTELWKFLSEVFFFFFFTVLEQKEWHQNETHTPGLWGLMISTCSGFTGKLVSLSHTSNGSEFFNRTFTHPFTPSWKPAEVVITHNYWDLSVTKQRHFCLLSALLKLHVIVSVVSE